MTLLTVSDLDDSMAAIYELESRCLEMTDKTPYQIGCRAMNVQAVDRSQHYDTTVACVPVTAGIGVLGNFCHIVADIIRRFCGARAFVTTRMDVAGIQEAHRCGADIVFMADDDVFFAYNVHTKVMSDNSDATGRIFAALLECASGGIDDEVLVLGAGGVGRGAYRYLQEQGCDVRWFDVHPDVPKGMDPLRREPQWDRRSWNYIVEATTAYGLVDACNVTPRSVVSAPGVPFGLTPQAVDAARLVMHDNLALGVVAMFCQAACPPIGAE